MREKASKNLQSDMQQKHIDLLVCLSYFQETWIPSSVPSVLGHSPLQPTKGFKLTWAPPFHMEAFFFLFFAVLILDFFALSSFCLLITMQFLKLLSIASVSYLIYPLLAEHESSVMTWFTFCFLLAHGCCCHCCLFSNIHINPMLFNYCILFNSPVSNLAAQQAGSILF